MDKALFWINQLDQINFFFQRKNSVQELMNNQKHLVCFSQVNNQKKKHLICFSQVKKLMKVTPKVIEMLLIKFPIKIA